MSIAKVIEIHAEGSSIEEAAEAALKEAGKTVEQIRSLYIEDIKVIVKDNKISKYRLNTKVTFVIKN